MNATGLLHNRRFNLAVLLVATLLAIILTMDVLTAKASTPYVSDISAVVCASIAAILYVWAWRRMGKEDVTKRVWGLVALGIVLWTVAETVWGFYELVLQQEIPYPSVADLFWLAGYAPFYLALLMRYRSFQSAPSTMQRWVVLLFILLYTGLLIVYVALPILDTFDTTRLAEGLINIAYPLADWGLLILTLVIIFSLEHGRFATVWRLFGAGILLTATADLIFFYATWNEIYYPGGQVNLISGLLDALFNLSYLVLALAIYAYMLLGESLPASRISIVLKSLAKMEVLLFVNPQGRILSLSDNFMNLVHVPATKPYIGTDLTKALGIEGAEAKDLLSRIVQRKSLSNYAVPVKDSSGAMKMASLTSLVMLDEQSQLDSIALVLRADPPPAGEAEIPLKEDQRMLIDYYLTKTGTSRVEDDQALRAYFLEQINLLHSLIEQYNGPKVADKLLAHLSQAARLNNWQFSHSDQDINIPPDFHGQALSDLLLPLLQEARVFTADVTDRRMMEQELNSLDKNVTPEALLVLDKYGFRAQGKPATKSPARSPLAA